MNDKLTPERRAEIAGALAELFAAEGTIQRLRSSIPTRDPYGPVHERLQVLQIQIAEAAKTATHILSR